MALNIPRFAGAIRNRVPNILRKVSALSTAPIKLFAGAATRGAIRTGQPSNIVRGVVAGAPAIMGTSRGVVGGFRAVGTGASNLASRALGNPLAGRTTGQFAKKIAGQALGTGLFLGAIDIAGNDAISFRNIARSVGAAALNPIGAVIGTGIRAGKGAVKGAADIYGGIVDYGIAPKIPDFNFQPSVNPVFGGGGIPEALPGLSFSAGSASFSPGAPSLSVGGAPSVGDFAVLAALAGLGGYAIGRRKRKRKYKKRRSRKR